MTVASDVVSPSLDPGAARRTEPDRNDWAPTDGEKSSRSVVVYGVIVAALLAVVAAELLVGEGHLRDAGLRNTLLSIRATRLGAGLLMGAALGAAGVMVQGLFRNPLADPSVLGTSAGAMFGGNAAVLALELLVRGHVLPGLPPDAVLPIGCLAGALLALAILLALLRRTGKVLSVILTGFLLSSLFLSLESLVASLAQAASWELGRAVVSFAFGGLTGTAPIQIAVAAPLIAAGLVATWFWGGPLDLLLSGDEEATSLGVDLVQVRRYCVLWTAVLTAGAVSLGGNVAFVGLLVAHSLRPLLGVAHRRLIPAAALGGAVFIAGCDVLARSLPVRGELPLGVITDLLGAPVFLALLVRNQRDAFDA